MIQMLRAPCGQENLVKEIMKTTADDGSIPFWRIIRKNHLLINSPYTELCAENLRKEGFQVNQTGKGAFRVEDAEDQLFTLL